MKKVVAIIVGIIVIIIIIFIGLNYTISTANKDKKLLQRIESLEKNEKNNDLLERVTSLEISMVTMQEFTVKHDEIIYYNMLSLYELAKAPEDDISAIKEMIKSRESMWAINYKK